MRAARCPRQRALQPQPASLDTRRRGRRPDVVGWLGLAHRITVPVRLSGRCGHGEASPLAGRRRVSARSSAASGPRTARRRAPPRTGHERQPARLEPAEAPDDVAPRHAERLSSPQLEGHDAQRPAAARPPPRPALGLDTARAAAASAAGSGAVPAALPGARPTPARRRAMPPARMRRCRGASDPWPQQRAHGAERRVRCPGYEVPEPSSTSTGASEAARDRPEGGATRAECIEHVGRCPARGSAATRNAHRLEQPAQSSRSTTASGGRDGVEVPRRPGPRVTLDARLATQATSPGGTLVEPLRL